MHSDYTGNGPGNGQHPELSNNGPGGQQLQPDGATGYDFRRLGQPQYGGLPPRTRNTQQANTHEMTPMPDSMNSSGSFHGFVPEQPGQVNHMNSGGNNTASAAGSFNLPPPLPYPTNDENTQQRNLATFKHSSTINDTHTQQLGDFAPARTEDSEALPTANPIDSQPPDQINGENRGGVLAAGRTQMPPSRQSSDQSGVSTIPSSETNAITMTGMATSTPAHTQTHRQERNDHVEALSDELHRQIKNLMPINTQQGPMFKTSKGSLAAVFFDLIDYEPHISLMQLFCRLKGVFFDNLRALYATDEDIQNSHPYQMWLKLEEPWFICQSQHAAAQEQRQQTTSEVSAGGETEGQTNETTPHDSQKPTPVPRQNKPGGSQVNSSGQETNADVNHTPGQPPAASSSQGQDSEALRAVTQALAEANARIESLQKDMSTLMNSTQHLAASGQGKELENAPPLRPQTLVDRIGGEKQPPQLNLTETAGAPAHQRSNGVGGMSSATTSQGGGATGGIPAATIVQGQGAVGGAPIDNAASQALGATPRLPSRNAGQPDQMRGNVKFKERDEIHVIENGRGQVISDQYVAKRSQPAHRQGQYNRDRNSGYPGTSRVNDATFTISQGHQPSGSGAPHSGTGHFPSHSSHGNGRRTGQAPPLPNFQGHGTGHFASNQSRGNECYTDYAPSQPPLQVPNTGHFSSNSSRGNECYSRYAPSQLPLQVPNTGQLYNTSQASSGQAPGQTGRNAGSVRHTVPQYDPAQSGDIMVQIPNQGHPSPPIVSGRNAWNNPPPQHQPQPSFNARPSAAEETVSNDWHDYRRFDWPYGWVLDEARFESSTMKEVKERIQRFDGSSLRYPETKSFITASIHHNTSINVGMKSYLLGQILNERSRNLIGFQQTSSIQKFSAMLANLDMFYERNRTTAFEEAIRNIGQFNTNSPDCTVLEKVINVLHKATDELGNSNSTSSIINLVLPKLGDLGMAYIGRFPFENQRSLFNLNQFLSPYYIHFTTLRSASPQPNVTGRSRQISRDMAPPPPKTTRGKAQVHQTDEECMEDRAEAFIGSSNPSLPGEEGTVTSQDAVCGEQDYYESEGYEVLLGSKQGQVTKKVPPFDKAKHPPCPACSGSHWLNYCGRFNNEMNFKERLKLVEALNRCKKCLGPRCISADKCRFSKGNNCEYCNSNLHTSRLHDFDSDPVQNVIVSYADKIVAQAATFKAVEVRLLTISFDVTIVRNPKGGKSLKINLIRDVGCTETLLDNAIRPYCNLEGPTHTRTTKGVNGMTWTHQVTTCMVQLSSWDGYYQEVLPLQFTDNPCKGLRYVDWRNYISQHEELKYLEDKLPEPATQAEGMDQVSAIFGNDLPHLILKQDTSRPGPTQLGGSGWLKPVAIRTLLGWSVSGYTGHKPPEMIDVAEAKVTLSCSPTLAYTSVGEDRPDNQGTVALEGAKPTEVLNSLSQIEPDILPSRENLSSDVGVECSSHFAPPPIQDSDDCKPSFAAPVQSATSSKSANDLTTVDKEGAKPTEVPNNLSRNSSVASPDKSAPTSGSERDLETVAKEGAKPTEVLNSPSPTSPDASPIEGDISSRPGVECNSHFAPPPSKDRDDCNPGFAAPVRTSIAGYGAEKSGNVSHPTLDDGQSPAALEDQLTEQEELTVLLKWFFQSVQNNPEEAKDEILKNIERLWQSDQFHNDDVNLSPEEIIAEERFRKTFSQTESGKLQVGVAWKDGDMPNLPSNHDLALRRYMKHHERMVRKEDSQGLKSFFDEELRGLREAGYIVKVNMTEEEKDRSWFLTEFIVVNMRKTTSVRRMVFNLAETYQVGGQKIVLNNCIARPPNNISPLIGVLRRARRFAVLVGADVSRMFWNVLTLPHERRFFRFFWQEGLDPSAPIEVYELRSHLLGKRDSPFMCIKAVEHQMETNREKYPEAGKSISRSCMVDDMIDSRSTPQEGIQLLAEAKLFYRERAGMNLRKMLSNSPEVESHIQEEDRAPSIELQELESETGVYRTLGIVYIKVGDFFTFSFHPDTPKVWTLRSALSLLASLYDPCGLIAPFLITGRIYYQRIFHSRLEGGPVDWDKPLGAEEVRSFQRWLEACQDLEGLQFPRALVRHKWEKPCFHEVREYESSAPGLMNLSVLGAQYNGCAPYLPPASPKCQCECPVHTEATAIPATGGEDMGELDVQSVDFDRSQKGEKPFNDAEFFTLMSQIYHCFSDASGSGYGAVIYLVTHYLSGGVTCRLVEAKGRVAPRTGPTSTIPRLELAGCLLSSQMAKSVAETYELVSSKEEGNSSWVFWADSACVLYWLTTERKKQTFVNNRCLKILEATTSAQWRHVPGPLNPADSISRGHQDVQQLVSDHQYRHGPRFLYESPEFWPPRITARISPEAKIELIKDKAEMLDLCLCYQGVLDMGWSWHQDSSAASYLEQRMNVEIEAEKAKAKRAESNHFLSTSKANVDECSEEFAPPQSMVDECSKELAPPPSSIQSIKPQSPSCLVAAEVLPNSKGQECLQPWKFIKDVSPAFHPSNFRDLQHYTRVMRVWLTYKQKLREFCIKLKTDSSLRQKLQRQNRYTRRNLTAKAKAAKANVELDKRYIIAKWIEPANPPVLPRMDKESEEYFEPVKYEMTLHETEKIILQNSQYDCFPSEIKCLLNGSKLRRASALIKQRPEISESGFLVVKGRFMEAERQLIVLHAKHPVTRLLCADYHKHHLKHTGGIKRLLHEMKLKYFCPGIKRLLTSVLRDCARCALRYPIPFKAPMAPLNKFRLPGAVGEGLKPFCFGACVAVDFAGPFWVKEGYRKKAKRWLVVFACHVTRAVAVAKVDTLSAAGTLLCFVAFMLKNGIPREFSSDNGTNLRRANEELQLIADYTQKIGGMMESEYGTTFPTIKWTFTAVESPHQNGVVERLVGLVKDSLQKMTTKSLKAGNITDSEFDLLLLWVEAVLNSRPLVASAQVHGHLSSLTPNHFRLGNTNPMVLQVPKDAREELLTDHNRRWFLVQEQVEQFWIEMTTQFQETLRKVWTWADEKAPKIFIGQLVIVLTDLRPSDLRWPVAVVEGLERDDAGVIQTVSIRLRNNITRRSIHHLAPIPGLDEDARATTCVNWE